MITNILRDVKLCECVLIRNKNLGPFIKKKIQKYHLFIEVSWGETLLKVSYNYFDIFIIRFNMWLLFVKMTGDVIEGRWQPLGINFYICWSRWCHFVISQYNIHFGLSPLLSRPLRTSLKSVFARISCKFPDIRASSPIWRQKRLNWCVRV